MVKRKLLTNVKRTLALTLTSTVLATLLPGNFGGVAEVEAAVGNKNTDNTVFGLSGDYEKDDQWDCVFLGGEKYRILCMDATRAGYGTSSKNVLLDCEYVLDHTTFGERMSKYTDSYVREKIKNAVKTPYLSDVELSAIPVVTKAGGYNKGGKGSYYEEDLNDQFFALGARDFENDLTGIKRYTIEHNRLKRDKSTVSGDVTCRYWTRSWKTDNQPSYGDFTSAVTIVLKYPDGGAYSQGSGGYDLRPFNSDYCISPALCLDSSRVILDTTLDTEYGTNTLPVTNHKLTLFDDKIDFNVNKIRYDGDGKVTINYELGGDHKTNVDCISALVKDNSGKIYDYNKIAEFTSAPSKGVATYTLPASAVDGNTLKNGYKLCILAEDTYSKNFLTDNASKPVEFSHIHDYKYSLENDNTLIAKCSCQTKKLTLMSPENLAYDGSLKEATVDIDKKVFTGDYFVQYYKDSEKESNLLGKAPVTPGKYVAVCRYYVEHEDNHTGDSDFNLNVTYIIKDGTPTLVVPTAINLTENGFAQQLVNAGSANNGIIKYALGTDDKNAPAKEKFGTVIPTGIMAGTYYVWYMVEGNANYSNIDAQCIVSKIASKDEVHKHSLKKIEAKAATATTAGNTEYYYCEGCNTYFEDAAGTKVIAPNSWIIPATGAAEDKTHIHKLAHTPAKAATATEAGNIEYWTCTECGKFFSDADGKNEIQKDKLIIAATGKTEPDSPEPGNTATPEKKGNTISDSTASFVVTSSDAKNPTVAISKTKSTKATTIKVPATVKINGVTYKITEVGKNAFKNNKKAKKVVLNKNISKIGSGAFSGCSSLESVTGASGVTSIGANAFNGCIKLKAAPVGAKVTSIGDKAFYNCQAFKNFTIPVNVNKLGKQFAYGTKNIKTLTVKSKKLTSKNVKAGAYKGLGSNKTVVKVPKGTKKTNTKLFQSKGLNKKIKIQESK